MEIILCNETLGITQRALKVLRNTLAYRIDNKLDVWQVNSLDTIAYGFIILDYTKQQAIIIGDGFRSDGGGEGGAGHRAAQALLAIYGITPVEAEEPLDYTEDVEDYINLIDNLPEMHPHIPEVENPHYIDFIMRK